MNALDIKLRPAIGEFLLGYARQTNRITLSSDGLERNLLKAIVLKKYGLDKAISAYQVKTPKKLCPVVKPMASPKCAKKEQLTVNLKMKIELQKQLLKEKEVIAVLKSAAAQKPGIATAPITPRKIVETRSKVSLPIKQPSQKDMRLNKGTPLSFSKFKEIKKAATDPATDKTANSDRAADSAYNVAAKPVSAFPTPKNSTKGLMQKAGRFSSLEACSTKTINPPKAVVRVRKNMERVPNQKLYMTLAEGQISGLITCWGKRFSLTIEDQSTKHLQKKAGEKTMAITKRPLSGQKASLMKSLSKY